jgi:hypothetical protein
MAKSAKPKKHVLRPLFWWLILVLVLFGIRTHQRLCEKTRLAFSVSLQGQPLYDASAKLDGQPFDSGNHISIGSHRLVISQIKAVSFSTNFFNWYGPHDIGEIKLIRGQGTLNVQADPPAPKITITGPEFSTTLYDCAGTNFTVPTDQYTVSAEYPHWSQSQNVAVFADTTAFGIFSPRMGALHLTCNRDGATFDLRFSNGQNAESGNLPATVDELPAGGYQLTVSYHNRPLQKNVLVEAGMTNEVPLEFVFGTARLESDPSGAGVRTSGGIYLGQTPLDLPDITPQRAQFNLSLSGYEPVSVTLEIVADQTNYSRTDLVSLRYLSAMRDARAYLAVSNYDAVVLSTGEALNAKPGDADALALQAEASGPVNAERQREEQLKRPREVFNLICSQNSNARLFNEYELKTSKPAKEVEAAIVKSLQASPRGFEILDDESPQPETYQVMAQQTFSLGILGGTERDCLLVVGQTKDDETQILFKVLEFQVQHTLVNFRDEKQLIPLHPSRIQMNDMLQSQVQDGIRNVTERIRQGIGQ